MTKLERVPVAQLYNKHGINFLNKRSHSILQELGENALKQKVS
ncbi:hypothetical protein [Nostoc sp. WHI]|nr:hypothetical protein [Nostoc sp. WHI]